MTLGPGAAVRFDVACAIAPSATGTLTNTASLLLPSRFFDGAPGDDTSSVSTTLVPEADLSVTKADLSDPVLAGGSLFYRITVANAGPATATGVTVGDPLPPELTVVDVTPSQGSCTETQEVFCSLGSLGPGATATVAVEVAVSSAASGAITNAAAVVANEVDLNAGNDTDTEITTLSP